MPQIIFPLLLVAAFYFLLVRPQQTRVRRQQALVSSIQVGDEVATAGGAIGTVTEIDDERAKLRVAPGVEITFFRFAIARRITAVDRPATDVGLEGHDHLTEDGE
jgi:preprotein translocase subunit YajC